MEKQLINTVQTLRFFYRLIWILPILYIVLGEADIIPVGAFVGEVRISYFLETACILITALAVPLSLKLFDVMLRKKIDTYTFPVALVQYKKWSIIRLAILAVGIFFSLISYYLTLSSTGALCAFIGLTASVFCKPSEKKLREELHISADLSDEP